MINYEMILCGGIVLLICVLFWVLCDISCAFLNLILELVFQPKKTFAIFKKIGFWKTIKQYIKEVWDDPIMKGWWSF